MKQLEYFSWFKPAVEDFHFGRDAKDHHIKKRIIDLTGGGTGILKGEDNELEAYVANPAQFLEAKVKTGKAYIQGEGIEIGSEQTVNLDDVETEANIIYLKYKLIDSSDPDAIRQHPITGEPHVVWKVDSFELGAIKESNYVVSDDKMKLTRVAKVGSDLKITHDYREWLTIHNDVIPDEVLRKQSAPPVPNHLDLSTGWDDVYRKTGASAGLISHRPAYILAEFGDKGIGTASGITFTKTSNRVGAWTVDEWIGYYLTCSDGQSWKVVSNTTDTLTLETGDQPVNGNFWLGPNAAGYKLVIQTLDPSTEDVVAEAEVDAQAMESPVKMEFMWHGLTADVKYQIKIASRGGWFQDEWSSFCSGESIIAGGPKEIPDACADAIDGDVTISADDDGIRLSWSVKTAYVSKVSGFEICWTDDGTSAPDFDNLNHRKVFTDRNFVVIPAKMSSETATTTVKAKMRCVDKAGRHCVTPKTLTDTNAKKYPADIAAIVTDRKSILTPGNFPTLKAFLEKSVTLSNGMPKGITAVESEMADARGAYSTVGARITAILGAGVDWKYVRIVAKDDTGHFSTIQAAVDSIPTNNSNVSWLIYIMPGVYIENINLNRSQSNNMSISFIGLGRVVIKGRIYNSAETSYTSIAIRKLVNIHFYREIGASGHTLRLKGLGIASTFIRNCQFYNVSNNCKDIYIPHGIESLIIEHCNFNITNHNALHLVGYSTSKIKIRNTELYAGGINNIYIEGQGGDCNVYVEHCALRTGGSTPCVDGDANPSTNKLYINHCKYVTVPNATNLTIDYGTADNQTNVLFDDGDFWAGGMIVDTLE